MELVYRFLNASEYPRLKAVFEEYKAPLPDPKFSCIAVAEDETKEIKGFLVMQLIAHEEPMWVAEESRGKVFLPALYRMVETAAKSLGFSGIMTTSEQTAIQHFCETRKMEKLSTAVYVTRF
jgi:hypothetical protein